MIKRISEFLDLLVSVVKARWILLIFFGAILSALLWIRNKLFFMIEIQIPIIATVFIGLLVLYPAAKFLEWLLDKKQNLPIPYEGLLWRPSRLRFRYPTALCPHCECEVLFQEERNSMFIVQSRQDFENIPDKMAQYIYQCPTHGVLPVSNKHLSQLQELAKILINSQKKT
ncbi:MAG: hypothetical protein GY755_11220 [Chloroflexi bacterium]|nr:hypothetical protein [Chloroflexota bacterium]